MSSSEIIKKIEPVIDQVSDAIQRLGQVLVLLGNEFVAAKDFDQVTSLLGEVEEKIDDAIGYLDVAIIEVSQLREDAENELIES